jgi:hypothetical protein
MFGVVRKCAADLIDREVDSVLEIDEGRVPPEAALNLLTRNNLPGMLNKEQQNSEGLRLELSEDAGLAQFA